MSTVATAAQLFSATFRCMNTNVSLELSLPTEQARVLVDTEVVPFFREFERQCSRFLAGNPLERLNASPNEWVQVPDLLHTAIIAAHEAYQLTGGAFDPRILRALQHLGYESSFDPSAGAHGSAAALPPSPAPWQPQFRSDHGGHLVNLGGAPIDLGGIGKGLAVDLMSAKLSELAPSGVLNAGGDLQCWGTNAEGALWRVGIDDPGAAASHSPAHPDPIAVLQLTNRGLATSSISKRQWTTVDGANVHHLVNPATGLPAEPSLRSVTVLHKRTQVAETLTKDLLLAGAHHIAQRATELEVPALWVDAHGALHASAQLGEALLWART